MTNILSGDHGGVRKRVRLRLGKTRGRHHNRRQNIVSGLRERRMRKQGSKQYNARTHRLLGVTDD